MSKLKPTETIIAQTATALKIASDKFERVEFVLLAFIFVLFSGLKEKCKPWVDKM